MTTSKLPASKRIIQHMREIYRMWRLMRAAERRLFNEEEAKKLFENETPPEGIVTTPLDLNTDFCELKKLSGKRYTSLEAAKAMFMAESSKYLSLNRKGGKIGEARIGITAQGVKFASISGLLNELSGAIGNIPPVFALFISVVALTVALYNKK